MPKDVLAQLRKALLRSPLSQADVARASNLKESVVSRFRRGADLTIPNAQAIANAIGHELKLVKKPAKGKKGGR